MPETAPVEPLVGRATAVTVAALTALLVALTALVVAGWAPLVAADLHVAVAAQALVTGARLVTAALVVTDAGSPVAVDVLTAVACVLLFLRGARRPALYLLLVRIAALAVGTALKTGVARPRPDVVAPLTTASGLSFPSGHTYGTTALCCSVLVVVSPVLRRAWQALAVGAAVLFSLAVAASRVLLGVHYLSDVVGGLLTGALVAFALIPLLRHRGPPPRAVPGA